MKTFLIEMEIMPCVACKSIDNDIILDHSFSYNGNSRTYKIMCECGQTTGEFPTGLQALQDWNSRQ